MPRIAVVPGDGIGTEVIAEAVKVLAAVRERGRLPLEWVEFDFGAERYLRTGTAVTDAEMSMLESEYQAVLLGALGDPRVPDHAHARAILLGLRFRLDLYVNLRPVKLYAPELSPLREPGAVDLVIYRENTEGVYTGVGGSFRRGTPDEVALEEDIHTRRGVERIVRAAFEHARAAGLPRITMTDKANAMRHVGDLWRRVFEEVGGEYPEIEREAVYVDALALDLVRRPAHYRIIVASNLFGDILSDLAAALVGGLGLAPSANLHPGRHALFEPVHGSAPELAGRGLANPMAAILSVALLLEHLGFPHEAESVEGAVRAAIREGRTTPDLGGSLGTAAAGDAVCAALAAAPA
jgi:3-isopropylmalate dehydrogenase